MIDWWLATEWYRDGAVISNSFDKLVDDAVDIEITGDLPDDMSPYVFFIVFNDTTFVSYNSNRTSSHVNTQFHFHFLIR